MQRPASCASHEQQCEDKTRTESTHSVVRMAEYVYHTSASLTNAELLHPEEDIMMLATVWVAPLYCARPLSRKTRCSRRRERAGQGRHQAPGRSEIPDDEDEDCAQEGRGGSTWWNTSYCYLRNRRGCG